MTDPREAAARYRARQQAPKDPDESDEQDDTPSAAAAVDRAAFIESAIQVAIRRGDFDDLPGAGKPIEGLGDHHDPDWWIRRKIETENLTGLGPAPSCCATRIGSSTTTSICWVGRPTCGRCSRTSIAV